MSRSFLPHRLSLLAVGLAFITVGQPASAALSPTKVIDGPSSDIRELGAVAMASDGTGGLVYRKDVDGRARIFVSRFVDGEWLAPQRVDTGQSFDSSWPAIGAGDDGRLVVVWVQEFGSSDRLFSASLQPGSQQFEDPVPVDLAVGDSALGTYPHISMSPGGQAFVVYRVINDASPASAPPGNVLGEYRVARYDGQYWSGTGTPVNRSLASAQPTPTNANRPRIGTDQLGNAVVAWQELDDEFVPRIYARRVFQTGVGIARQVSPREIDGEIVRAGADQFALSVGRSGEAAIAWRQLPPPRGKFTRRRVMLALSPDVYSPDAATFGAPMVVDGGGDDGPEATVSGVSVAVAGPEALTSFGLGFGAAMARGSEGYAGEVEVIDLAEQSTVAGLPQGAFGRSGAVSFAWRRSTSSFSGVVVMERSVSGESSVRAHSGPGGGTVDSLQVHGSGLGDSLIAFSQGIGPRRRVVAASVDVPPDTFNVQAPVGFIRSAQARMIWDPSLSAIGGLSYSVTVNGKSVASGIKGLAHILETKGLPDGRLSVRVVATDGAGQSTASAPVTLELDRRPPTVDVRTKGKTVRVSVTDGPRGQVSGVADWATSISFGDGARASSRTAASHSYRRSGTYSVTVRTSDQAGNPIRTTRRVSVR